jgi:hypothetical protein
VSDSPYEWFCHNLSLRRGMHSTTMGQDWHHDTVERNL